MSRKKKRRRNSPRFRDVGLRLPDAKPPPDDAILDLPPIDTATRGELATSGASGDPPSAEPSDGSTTRAEPSTQAGTVVAASAEPSDGSITRPPDHTASVTESADGHTSATADDEAATEDPAATGAGASEPSVEATPASPPAPPDGWSTPTTQVGANDVPLLTSADVSPASTPQADTSPPIATEASSVTASRPEAAADGAGRDDAAEAGADVDTASPGNTGNDASSDERGVEGGGADRSRGGEGGGERGAGASEADGVEAVADPERSDESDVEVPAGVATPGGAPPDESDVEVPAGVATPGGAPPGAGRRPSVQEALRALNVPDHAPHFWQSMADELADEPQLRLRPRAAVRPVTQPPPISEDRFTYDDGSWRQRRVRRRRALWVVVAVIAVLAAVGAFQAADDGTSEAQVDDATTTSTSREPAEDAAAGDDASGGDMGDQADDTPPPPVDPAAALSPDGVGPLTVGVTLRDLEALGLTIVVDEPTFRGTGGTCFDATVADVGDLALRFRGPAPGQVISEPRDGVLGALTIDRQRGSFRTTPEGVGLDSPAEQVRNAYGDGLREAPHPFLPSGQILTYVPDSGAPNGLAFTTDRGNVASVTAGAVDLIASPDGCPS